VDGVLLPRTELDAAEQDARFMDACVEAAISAAETDQHITLQKSPFTWVFDDIERRCGRRPTNTELKETLALAVRLGKLRYQRGHGKDRAGYMPPLSAGPGGAQQDD
jgi:hypothetical protein